MSSRVLKGFWSAANWARKIAGPLTVFIVGTHSFPKLSSQAHPSRTRPAAHHRSLHKGHAAHSPVDADHRVTEFRCRIAEAGSNGGCEVAIDISKCFQESLGMTHGQPQGGSRGRRPIGP